MSVDDFIENLRNFVEMWDKIKARDELLIERNNNQRDLIRDVISSEKKLFASVKKKDIDINSLRKERNDLRAATRTMNSKLMRYAERESKMREERRELVKTVAAVKRKANLLEKKTKILIKAIESKKCPSTTTSAATAATSTR